MMNWKNSDIKDILCDCIYTTAKLHLGMTIVVITFRGMMGRGLSHLLLITFFVFFWVSVSWVCTYMKTYWVCGLCALPDVSYTSVERKVVLKEDTWTLFLSWKVREAKGCWGMEKEKWTGKSRKTKREWQRERPGRVGWGWGEGSRLLWGCEEGWVKIEIHLSDSSRSWASVFLVNKKVKKSQASILPVTCFFLSEPTN